MLQSSIPIYGSCTMLHFTSLLPSAGQLPIVLGCVVWPKTVSGSRTGPSSRTGIAAFPRATKTNLFHLSSCTSMGQYSCNRSLGKMARSRPVHVSWWRTSYPDVSSDILTHSFPDLALSVFLNIFTNKKWCCCIFIQISLNRSRLFK